MAFITRIDYSNNRQISQLPETVTYLSGSTVFGLPYNQLLSGPDLTTSGITNTYTGVISTFSGNSATTVYTWYNNEMQTAINLLSPITPINSGITQNTGILFSGDSTSIIDGNTVNLSYSGISFDITPMTMIISGDTYIGTSYTSILNFYSAGTLDYTGRTIWVDVSGITRTQTLLTNDLQLISLNNPPASSSDKGTVGQIKIDSNYIYVCVAPDSWKRTTLDNF